MSAIWDSRRLSLLKGGFAPDEADVPNPLDSILSSLLEGRGGLSTAM